MLHESAVLIKIFSISLGKVPFFETYSVIDINSPLEHSDCDSTAILRRWKLVEFRFRFVQKDGSPHRRVPIDKQNGWPVTAQFSNPRCELARWIDNWTSPGRASILLLHSPLNMENREGDHVPVAKPQVLRLEGLFSHFSHKLVDSPELAAKTDLRQTFFPPRELWSEIISRNENSLFFFHGKSAVFQYFPCPGYRYKLVSPHSDGKLSNRKRK